DGIRDRNVTGVQTCALPISIQRIAVHVLCIDNRCFQRRSGNTPSKQSGRMVTPQKLVLMEPVCSNVYFYDMFLCNPSRRFEPQRSEERRVGKECRLRGERGG